MEEKNDWFFVCFFAELEEFSSCSKQTTLFPGLLPVVHLGLGCLTSSTQQFQKSTDFSATQMFVWRSVEGFINGSRRPGEDQIPVVVSRVLPEVAHSPGALLAGSVCPFSCPGALLSGSVCPFSSPGALLAGSLCIFLPTPVTQSPPGGKQRRARL